MRSTVKYVDSEIRRNRLTKSLVVALFVVSVFYLMLYFIFGWRSIDLLFVFPFVAIAVVLHVMLHFGFYTSAKVLGLLMFNIALFFVASSESTATGVYLHYVTCIAVAITIFRYEQRRISIAFAAFSMAQLLAVNLFSFDFVPERIYPPDLIRLLFAIHAPIVAFISVSCILLIMAMNVEAEHHLKEKQRVIEMQNEELKKANQELDRFVYSASHDLRAPLTGISGLIGLMEIDHETPPEVILDKIKGQVNKMDNFITDIVNYSRNSRQEVNLENLSLRALVDEVFKTLSHFELAPRMAMRNDIDPAVMISTDRHRMKVILTNVIGNSIRYADVSKSEPFVAVTFEKLAREHAIHIQDNGVGIAAAYLPKIFDMFFRANNSSKGSGLGLYIVKEAVKKLNYRVEVVSQEGSGSTFSILIPA